MSKAAVREEMSKMCRGRADRVKEEREKEKEQEKQEKEEMDERSRKSFTKLLSDIKQGTKAAERATVDDELLDDKNQADKAGSQPGEQQMKPMAMKRGTDVYTLWAQYMMKRDDEARKLQGQVANLQEIVQKLEGFATGCSGINSKFNERITKVEEEIANLKKEQEAAAEALELIAKEIGKMR